MRRLLEAGGLAAVALYAVRLRALEPEAGDLLRLRWHREAPLRLVMKDLAGLLPRLYGRYGERGVKALQYVFYRVGTARARAMRDALRIDVTDARSLGRVLDFEDAMAGVRGVWTEETRGRAIKEERYCPARRELASCPEVCTSLMMAMEAGTFSAMNARIEVPELTKLLSRGDDCCLAVIELAPEVAGDRAAEVSLQATPGAFPPVVSAPSLRWRMPALAALGAAKALLELATQGPDRPMEMYEFFRYCPGDAA